MIKKIVMFLRKPRLLMLQTLLERLPFKPFDIALFYILHLVGAPKGLSDSHTCSVRLAALEDIERLTQCINKAERFQARFKQGDRCILAVVDGKVVGFMWFCVNQYHIEGRYGYKVYIPSNTVYVYDEYVIPTYRRKGILKQLWLFLSNWMKVNSQHAVLIMIDFGNDISWEAHAKMGFYSLKRVFF